MNQKKINLIGISGKKGSGKNTTAFIIQHIIARLQGNSTASWPEKEDAASLTLWSGWEQKSFAHKLKEMVSLLTGIPVGLFEDQKFKEKPLGKEWDCWLIPNPEYKIPQMFPLDVDIDWIAQGRQYVKRSLTPRAVLQLLGTEGIREVIHPNAWVNALFADYWTKPVLKEGESHHPNWIITDVRFPNEVKAIEDRGGIVIRVDRPLTKEDRLCEKCSRPFNPSTDPLKAYGCSYCGHPFSLAKSSIPDNHYSEIALDNHDFSYYIMNRGTMEDLQKATELFLKAYNII